MVALTACQSSIPATPRTDAEKQIAAAAADRAEQVRKLLDAGQIKPGQTLDELLGLSTPHHIEFVEQYAFIEYQPVPNLQGVSLIAVDGRLVSASRWTDVAGEYWFNTLSDAQRQAAFKLYTARMALR